ncbi:MAG: ClpP family protease, partial [Phycisphaeraceae bacterium]
MSQEQAPLSPYQAAMLGLQANSQQAGGAHDAPYNPARLAPPMGRYREITIDEILVYFWVVLLLSEIYTGSAMNVVMRLLHLQNSKPGVDIHLYINSPGGSVDDTLAMIDTMNHISSEVSTYCIGKAMSGGA